MLLDKISTYNGFGFTGNTEMAGDIPIWQNPEALEMFQSGFTIANAPLADALVPGGTPVQVDEAARTAGICYRFTVYEEAADDAVAIKIVKDYTKYGNLAKVGMNIMKFPAAVTTAGAAYPITAIDTSNAAYDVITLGTTLGETLAVGTVLAEADSTHATTAELLYVANALSRMDILVRNNSLGVSVGGVYHGRIYDRRIRKIDAVEKLQLPEIKFSQLK